VFWPLFLAVALGFGWYAWNRGVEQRCRRYIELMGHPNANIAGQAWWDLRELYFTKWAAYSFILDHLDDDRPVSFLIEREPRPDNNQPMFHTRNRPIYYRSDRVWCHTVSDAMMAFIYDERKWKSDFEGDWGEWWRQNQGYYGKP